MTTKRPYAQPGGKRRNVYIDEDTLEALCQLGEQASGKRNASAGIREAVRIANQETKS